MLAYAPGDLKGLIDSTPGESVLVHLAEHHAGRTLPDTGVDSHLAFDSPRTQLMIRTLVQGSTIAAHFHTVCDEIVVITGGHGELLINGEWIPVQAGDVHVCPRGIVHSTRAPEEGLQFLSIFAPHLPTGTDINLL